MIDDMQWLDKQALELAYIQYAEFQDNHLTQFDFSTFDFSTQVQETKFYEQQAFGDILGALFKRLNRFLLSACI